MSSPGRPSGHNLAMTVGLGAPKPFPIVGLPLPRWGYEDTEKRNAKEFPR